MNLYSGKGIKKGKKREGRKKGHKEGRQQGVNEQGRDLERSEAGKEGWIEREN